MSKIEMGKQYRTRDGREVRIYAIEPKGMYPVHGAILTDGVWASSNWDHNGSYYFDRPKEQEDLIEVRPRIKREVWVNVYPGLNEQACHNKKCSADKWAGDDRIACVKITIDCEEGEGL